MRAVLRYRRIPHDWVVPPKFRDPEGELAKAGKGIIPVMQLPDGRYWADSTPMILALEQMHPRQRSVLPDDPADRFLALLLEDIADEWLVFAMFDFRWAEPVDQEFCARRQMAGWFGAMPGDEFDKVVDFFRNRQVGMLARAGDLAPTVRSGTRATPGARGDRDAGPAQPLLLRRPAVDRRLRPLRPALAARGRPDAVGDHAARRGAHLSMAARSRRCLGHRRGMARSACAARARRRRAARSSRATRTCRSWSPTRPRSPQAPRPTTCTLHGKSYPNPTRSYKRRCLLWLKAALAEVQGEPRVRLEKILKAVRLLGAAAILGRRGEDGPAARAALGARDGLGCRAWRR